MKVRNRTIPLELVERQEGLGLRQGSCWLTRSLELIDYNMEVQYILYIVCDVTPRSLERRYEA